MAQQPITGILRVRPRHESLLPRLKVITGIPRVRHCRRSGTDHPPDHGSVSAEMAILVLPMAAIMTMFAIFCAHLAGTRLDLNATAATAARAASMARTPDAAHTAAHTAATTNLASHHRTCTRLIIDVDTRDFQVGGQVTVTVTCTISTATLTGMRLPGTLNGSATAHATIDSHRYLPGRVP